MVVLVEQDTLICRCLQVSESTLAEALDRCSLGNLQDVARETGAGSGCMSCHRTLRRWIAQRRGLSAENIAQQVAECAAANGCGGGCYSPPTSLGWLRT